jgi:hypothetical protein
MFLLVKSYRLLARYDHSYHAHKSIINPWDYGLVHSDPEIQETLSLQRPEITLMS